MKQMPRIDRVMTPMPHTVGEDQPIQVALGMMREHRIRHLPVQKGGVLVGVVTDRDIKLASAFQGASSMKVAEVMTPEPFTAGPHAALDAVAAEMAEHKYGCAIVCQENGKVVGIFTAIDALRFLADTLRGNYKPAGS